MFVLKKCVFATVTSFALLFSLCACTREKTCERLTDVLFGEYVAEIEFTFHSENGDTTGEATVTKGGRTVIEFYSPELLSGVTAESDEGGNADIVTIGYYGMRVPLPSGSLSKINMLLSLFSDETSSAAERLSNEEINDLPPKDGDAAENTKNTEKLKMCTFKLSENTDVELVFEPIGGIIREFTLKNENMTVGGRVKNLKIIEVEANE